MEHIPKRPLFASSSPYDVTAISQTSYEHYGVDHYQNSETILHIVFVEPMEGTLFFGGPNQVQERGGVSGSLSLAEYTISKSSGFSIRIR